MQNPNCDGSGPCILNGEVRVLPTGGDSNAILCKLCYQREMRFRHSRNLELAPENHFLIPKWNDLQTYH